MNFKTLKIFLTFLCFVLVQIACENTTEPNNSKTSEEYGTGDDYLIYSVVLDSVQLDNKTFIMIDSTNEESFISGNIDYFLTNLPDAEEETLYNYISQNQTKIKLKKIEGINFTFYSEQENPNQSGTRVSLSRVGYNWNKTQAILTIGIIYAPLAGYGSLFLLNYKNGKWSVKASIMTWIS
ncbi:MAG: hypothetical protein WAR79_12550 [Melioribacteraceae bacterium]